MSTNRRDSPGAHRGRGRPRPGQVDAGHDVAPVDERRVEQREVGTLQQRGQVVAVVGVAGEGQHGTGGLDPVAVGLDRVVHGVRGDGERAHGERHGIRDDAEVELGLHAARLEAVVHQRHPLGRAGRAVHGQAVGQRAGGAVAPGDVEPAQVDAVVGVQVAEHDGVEVVGRHVALERPEGAAAEVEQEVPGAPVDLVLHQVGRRGRLGAGEGPGAADDRDPHAGSAVTACGGEVNTGPSREPTPRKRLARRRNSSGSPVVVNPWSGCGRSSGRSRSASASTR